METTTSTWKPGILLQPIDLTPPIIAAIKEALPPTYVAALTIWREAESAFVKGRGWVPNPLEAMLDILTVIAWRAADPRPRWRGKGIKGICLERWAFSCWEPHGGPDDPKDADELAENFETVMEWAQRLLAGELPNPDSRSGRALLNCLAAAEAAVAGTLVKTLPEATCHYYAEWLPQPPKWAIGHAPVAHRHGHLFFNDVA